MKSQTLLLIAIVAALLVAIASERVILTGGGSPACPECYQLSRRKMQENLGVLLEKRIFGEILPDAARHAT